MMKCELDENKMNSDVPIFATESEVDVSDELVTTLDTGSDQLPSSLV